jgi:S-adenosylmethionine-diacylglycerol 3-amino-3-carboxypropyl transferase
MATREHHSTEISERASFAGIRYANCWEDADVLVRSLAPLRGARCLSIASAGDNTLSLLAGAAGSVVAVDLSPGQLALVELKMAAFRRLPHEELLGFLGVRHCTSRRAIYADLRGSLGEAARAFWNARGHAIARGVVHCGRLERYFTAFRRWVLPFIHGRGTVDSLFAPKSPKERERFFEERWNTGRWRLLVRVFFGRRVMGRLGRDPEFFRYAEGPVAEHLLARARYALTALSPHDNPYLRYVLTGRFGPTLPHYLRPEHYARIREGLDRVRLFLGPVEDAAAHLEPASIDAFNLSDVAEYMDLEGYHLLLERLRAAAAPEARLVYWNLLAPRRRPDSMGHWLAAREERAHRLGAEARAFFYRALVIEVVR